MAPKPSGGFQLKKIVGPDTKVADVSITVPGVQKPLGLQTNRTNQVRDARERLIAKNKPRDARECIIAKNKPRDARDKLIQKAQSTDARQKLTNIRARKAQSQGIDMAVTRMVDNKVAVRPGPGGGVQFTRTLSRVMPPGYEDLQAPAPTPPPAMPGPRPPGPPLAQPLAPPQITRTFYTAPQPGAPGPPAPGPVGHLQPPPAPLNYGAPPVPAPFQPGPPQLVYQPPPGPPPPQYILHPQYAPPPGPQQFALPVHPHYIPAPAPPPAEPTPYTPPPTTDTNVGPPYPTDDMVTRTVTQEVPPHNQITVPVIQVRNDQYLPQPAQPPPYPTQEPPTHRPPPSPIYYPPAQPEQLQRTVPNIAPTGGGITKTVVNSGSVGGRPEAVAARPRPVGGPLRLAGSGGSIPVIDIATTRADSAPLRLRKSAPSDEPPVKRSREEVSAKPAIRPLPAKTAAVDDDSDVISPLQGYKVQVTNLHISVSQDDIIELFGALGAVKKARLIKAGVAEVIYVKREDAVTAQTTYHNRELDGLPMVVKNATPASARVREPPATLPPSVKPLATGPLKLNKKPAGMSMVSDKKSVDVETLHKALFKTALSTPSKPVTFTVNI